MGDVIFEKASDCGGVVQLVRTLACHARGREFESRHSRHNLRAKYASPSSSPVQDTGLSRRRQGFESPWGRHYFEKARTSLRMERAFFVLSPYPVGTGLNDLWTRRWVDPGGLANQGRKSWAKALPKSWQALRPSSSGFQSNFKPSGSTRSKPAWPSSLLMILLASPLQP